jgi:hypothetical protein
MIAQWAEVYVPHAVAAHHCVSICGPEGLERLPYYPLHALQKKGAKNPGPNDLVFQAKTKLTKQQT